ncbi:hypothetical protein BDQ94DRAFT_132796 [Aspergillus welwitschiae]|uniref:Uncharacterized protein n=1 Tax=Aspergillus welwitschiae TaxID=1341132 RepID=A0A3F3QJH6_9EURO|nr:hypothetical protein BDQ94DRAFT_132796 [Aspergillus welwitschiae]RDH39275.1 hypothetical protein BDQ94DRAFT_132796 [Aspergillus welwitschiae]
MISPTGDDGLGTTLVLLRQKFPEIVDRQKSKTDKQKHSMKALRGLFTFWTILVLLFSFFLFLCHRCVIINYFFARCFFFSMEPSKALVDIIHPSRPGSPVPFQSTSRKPDAGGANHITCLVILVLAGRRLVRNQGKP